MIGVPFELGCVYTPELGPIWRNVKVELSKVDSILVPGVVGATLSSKIQIQIPP